MCKILTSINKCKSMNYKCGSRRKTPLNGETPENGQSRAKSLRN